MEKKRCTAIVLAAGSGSRMKSGVAKQYMLLRDKPLIWYALRAVEDSAVIDDCILVTGAEDITYIQKEIVERYAFGKVDRIVAGGRERYDSVYQALKVIKAGDMRVPNRDGYLFIHDGARPFLTEEILRRDYEAAERFRACVTGMPVKDTIRIVDENGFSSMTPNRETVWQMQTPQVFAATLVKEAYEKLLVREAELKERGIRITDDAMVVETLLNHSVKMVEGSYENIKITTPEDLEIARSFLKK